MENKIIASIIITSFNNNELLNRCISSFDLEILNKIEIIVVDDGSTINQKKFIPKEFLQHQNFHIHKKANGGLGSARNFGIEKSSGIFVIFIDGDDMIDNVKINKFISFLEENKFKSIDLIRVGYKRINKTKSRIYTSNKIKYFHNISTYIKHAYFWKKSLAFSSWTHIYKRKFLIENNLFLKEKILAEDLEHLCRAINVIQNTVIWNDWYYIYDNTNQNSITNQSKTKMNNHICEFIVLDNIKYLRFKAFLALWFFIKIKGKNRRIKKLLRYLLISLFCFF